MATGTDDVRAGGAFFELNHKGTDSVQSALGQVKRTLETITTVAAMAGTAIAAGIAYATTRAGDYLDTLGKFKAVYKQQTDATQQWAEAFKTLYGTGSTNTLAMLAQLQDTFVPLGFAREQATELSKAVLSLANDLRAFDNMRNTSEVIDLLTSAIVGNHEAVRRFGIVITESRLDQKLKQLGVAGGTQAASELQKAFARLKLIFDDSADAQGGAAREMSGWNTVVMRAKESLNDLVDTIGMQLLPAIQPLVEWFGKVGASMLNFIKANDQLVPALLKLFETLGVVFGGIISVIAICNPWIVAFAAVGIAAVWVAEKLLGIDTGIQQISESLGVWDSIKTYMLSLMDTLVGVFSVIAESVNKAVASMFRAFSRFFGWLGESIEKVKGIAAWADTMIYGDKPETTEERDKRIKRGGERWSEKSNINASIADSQADWWKQTGDEKFDSVIQRSDALTERNKKRFASFSIADMVFPDLKTKFPDIAFNSLKGRDDAKQKDNAVGFFANQNAAQMLGGPLTEAQKQTNLLDQIRGGIDSLNQTMTESLRTPGLGKVSSDGIMGELNAGAAPAKTTSDKTSDVAELMRQSIGVLTAIESNTKSQVAVLG